MSIKNCFVIKYDNEGGAFERAEFTKAFKNESYLMQADVLKDILEEIDSIKSDIQSNYNRVVDEAFKKLKNNTQFPQIKNK